MKVELLMQVDHEVAVGSDALADLLERFDDLRNARARIERSSRPAAASRPPTGRTAGCAGTRAQRGAAGAPPVLGRMPLSTR